ncbi:uncharacterized protein LOC133903173 [Phragmites australis]|uniref:uncharacterized protein LOC133903173 n=1 Tax=Phragmites australis TaxID=29695 RepID=UPI002D791BAE|nr:uncharacterized protein LOC133903173 [Phragmites australis]
MAGGYRLRRSGSSSSSSGDMDPLTQEAPAAAASQLHPRSARTVRPSQGDQAAGPSRAAATAVAGASSNPQRPAETPAARSASGQRRAPLRRRLAFSEASPGSALLAAHALLRHSPVQAAGETRRAAGSKSPPWSARPAAR